MSKKNHNQNDVILSEEPNPHTEIVKIVNGILTGTGYDDTPLDNKITGRRLLEELDDFFNLKDK